MNLALALPPLVSPLRLPRAALVHPPEAPTAPTALGPPQTHRQFQPGRRTVTRWAAPRLPPGPALGSIIPATEGERVSKEQMPAVQNNSHLLVHTANTR